MPLYDFRCGTCRAEFEMLCRDARNTPMTCPECGGKTLSRLISRFAVSQNLTPCGTPAASREPVSACGYNPASGGCGRCQN